MKSLEITQDDKKTQEEENEDIQLEVVQHQLEDQKYDGENLSLPKEWRFVHNQPNKSHHRQSIKWGNY